MKPGGSFSLGKFCGWSEQIPDDVNTPAGEAGGGQFQPHWYFFLCSLSPGVPYNLF